MDTEESLDTHERTGSVFIAGVAAGSVFIGGFRHAQRGDAVAI